jgi:succinylarginine dihydrolase
MTQTYFETQFDGLIGPSHNYSGLSFGNVASTSNEGDVSKPRLAALQGLQKMEFVSNLGVYQFILPPPIRPNLHYARKMGLDLLDIATYQDLTPLKMELVRACWSASSMWAANAATISPQLHSSDAKLHITPANLASGLHRSQEANERYQLLKNIFASVQNVMVHDALPACTNMTDEGAANHMHLASSQSDVGVEIFVYGKADNAPSSSKFPARQSRKSFEVIAMNHKLSPERTIFVQQNPLAIDAGVFHNDVIAMSNENILIYHELSFANEADFLSELRSKAAFDLQLIRISNEELPIAAAVESYFYNSQLLKLPNGENCIVAPLEAKNNPHAHSVLKRIEAAKDNNVNKVHFIDVRESMKNGGGPACLRLRIIMTPQQMAAIPPQYHFNAANHEKIAEFVSKNYPEEIAPEMIYNPNFARQIIDVSTKLLELFE